VHRTTCSAILLLLFVLLLVCCEPTNYFVTELRIDDRQHLLPIGPRSLSEPRTASYYWFFHTGTGFTTVDHFGRKPGTGQRERLFYLETNRSQSLDRTVKRDEILRGLFGSVYFERTCFFNRPVASDPNYVSMSLRAKDEHSDETPMELSGSPEEPIPPLTSVSLVRIFHVDPEYVVVSASYESTGELGSLNVGRTRTGELISGSESTSLRIDSKDPRLQIYGVPARIDVQQYIRSKRLPLPSVAFDEPMTVVNQHYGFGKLMRQDQFRNGSVVSSRFLRPSVTEEEKNLNPECDAKFAQQRSMGLSTVE